MILLVLKLLALKFFSACASILGRLLPDWWGIYHCVTKTSFLRPCSSFVSRLWQGLGLIPYNNRVIVMTRYPEPGKCKSRLVPTVGKNGACQVQTLMTEHLVSQLKGDFDLEVRYTKANEEKLFKWLSKAISNDRFFYSVQPGGKLGTRISTCFEDAFKQGCDKVVICGADIPGINNDIVNEAFQKLDRADCVLGPAADGGYYLVGLRHSINWNILPCIFSNEDITWGTETVFQEQVKQLNALSISYLPLGTTLSDVDLGEDLPEFEKQVKAEANDLKDPTISVIIPTYNEEKTLEETVERLLQASSTQKVIQVIITDGGSTDKTKAVFDRLYTRYGKTNMDGITLDLVWVDQGRGRGSQLKQGARHATGSILFFVHSDTRFPKHWDKDILASLCIPGNKGCAFQFTVDALEPNSRWREKDGFQSKLFLLQMKIIQLCVYGRCNTWSCSPYGDQGLALYRHTYDKLGGYNENYPLLEDVDMVKRIQEIGVVDMLPSYLVTSSRRWEQGSGAILTTLFNRMIIFLFSLGVSPEDLYELYYGTKPGKPLKSA